ncbi:MAG: biotin transporter BioY [Oligoflexia bacterium]|nr:biotin transporter BioY [Oligoflexia bacterium]
MTNDKAFIPQLFKEKGASRIHDALIVGSGAVLISLLAQVKIMLPYTPVPITGQTLGVGLVALLLGSKRGTASVLIYLLMGTFGLPVFAGGRAGMIWGSTTGYLLGMVGAAYLEGWLADRGWSSRFSTTWLSGILGSVVIFASGLAMLSFFVPTESLLAAGLFPFIAGDLIKTFLAAGIVTGTQKFYSQK